MVLYLPCNFSVLDDAVMFHGCAGDTLNNLHEAFNKKMENELNSGTDLLCAQALGADLNCNYPGFLNRNLQVAKSEYIIAFTWGNSCNSPKEGGTKHTWDHCLSPHKIHIPLSTLSRTNPILEAFANNKSGDEIRHKRKISTHDSDNV